MTSKPPASAARTWFHRSIALTLGVGACLLLAFAVRPGYGAFFVTSTLAFLVAGFIWCPGEPPKRGRREQPVRPAAALGAPLSLARTYRISAAR